MIHTPWLTHTHTQLLVLMAIKAGALPLLMVGCAMAVRLDGQHVASLTLLTLCPAAAATFALALQYGRWVTAERRSNRHGNQ